jgi:hypothetical protein
MILKITVFAKDPQVERQWQTEIEQAVGTTLTDITVQSGAGVGPSGAGQLVLIDETMPDLDAFIASFDRRGRALVLVVRDGRGVPPAWADHRVDDVLVHPFRRLEVASKVQQIQQVFMWDEVSRLNASFSSLLGNLKDDMQVAERLQKARLPSRFPEIKGLNVTHRYLAGMKSGGDYFDIADSRDGRSLSLVLSDSSSYGLSSAVLGVLMKVAMKLSGDEARSAWETVKRIQEELLITLSEKDRLSLFYGVVSRNDWRLKYLNLGHSRAFYAGRAGGFRELPAQAGAIARGHELGQPGEQEFQLEPEGRLVLLSDGFVDAAGGVDGAANLLEEFRGRDAKSCLNEMVFRVKSAFAEEDDLPAQDCTAIVFDVESNVLRLARK